MKSILKTFVYNGFGHNIESEIPLPELIPIHSKVDKVDVIIQVGNLSKQWSEVDIELQKKFIVIENKIMFEVPKTAIFLIEDGNRITFTPAMGAKEEKIRLYILGTCMGAILIQKKILPLHGSAVAINGKAYAFVGDSGAGKSTLAATLINEGYPLLSDDVIPINLSEDSTPYVVPSYPHQKLWQESLTEFGMAASEYRPLFDRETKFAVPVHSKFTNESLPLGGIFELVKADINDVEIRRIEGLTRFQTLYNQTYRNFLIPRLNMLEWHFNETVKILSKVDMFQLQRPMKGFTANIMVSEILSQLRGSW